MRRKIILSAKCSSIAFSRFVICSPNIILKFHSNFKSICNSVCVKFDCDFCYIHFQLVLNSICARYIEFIRPSRFLFCDLHTIILFRKIFRITFYDCMYIPTVTCIIFHRKERRKRY